MVRVDYTPSPATGTRKPNSGGTLLRFPGDTLFRPVPPDTAPSAQDLAEVTDDLEDFDGLDAESVKLLEGGCLYWTPEAQEHEHRCPTCGQDWTHRDEECAEDGIPDPWRNGVTRSGYATCGDCA